MFKNIPKGFKTLLPLICIVIIMSGCQAKSSNVSKNISVTNSEDTKEYIAETESSGEFETLGEIDETIDNSDADNYVSQEVSIIMAGDVLLHTPVTESGFMDDGTKNYDHLFNNLTSEICSRDIAIANQEVILGGSEIGLSGYPAFNGPYEVGDALAKAGFDVILHATNHALDKGRTGIINCLNFWNTNYPDMKVLGISNSEEQSEDVCIIEKNGIKVAILNYTYGTNGISLPSDMPYCVNMLDKDKIARDVEKAKTMADFIVVCPHWGIEYQHDYTDSQEEYAKYMASLGVNLIIGTHPHVIEPVSWIEADNGNKTLVYYSLGNFINATSDYGTGVGDRMLGALADVKISRNSDGNVTISSYGAIPVITHMVSGTGKITTYKLSDYNQEMANQSEMSERDSTFSYDYCKDLAQSVFGDVLEN